MVIDEQTREKLLEILEGIDYRKVVAEKTGVHPNTVTNVLKHGSDNPRVALELLVLAQEVQARKDEEKAMRERAAAIAKQL